MPIQAPVGSQTLRVRFNFFPAQTLTIGAPKKIGFTLYWQQTSPVVGGIDVFKAAMDAALGALFVAAASVKLPVPTIVIRDLANYFNPDVVYPLGSNALWGPGGVMGDSLPWSSCANFEKQSLQSGKMNRGQLFIPGVPESGQEEGVLTVAQTTLYNAFGTALKTPIVIAGLSCVPQIFSPTLSNLKLGNPGVYCQPISGLDLDQIITNLKRRKPKPVYV
jgi:hypothetical protein